MNNLNINFLLNIIVLQQDKISELSEKLSINSENSSKAPSQDFIKRKNKTSNSKNKSNKKQGGQIGHKGINRKPVDATSVNNIIDCKTDLVCDCGANLIT